MTDQQKPPLTGDEPLTAKTIAVFALGGSDLPPLEDQTLAAWVDAFTDAETKRRAGELFRAAAAGDVNAARHWAHQTEDAYLRAQQGGKSLLHR